jgi:signal transduction histidine kinase
MERHFSLMRIGQRLRSLMRFTDCSAIAFKSGDLLYGYRKGPDQTLKEVLQSGEDIRPGTFAEDHDSAVTFPIRRGELVFFDPSPSIEVSTLAYLAKELEGDIRFASVIDTVFQASVAISSNLKLNPLLNKVMRISEEIFNPEVSAVMLLDEDKKELYWEISRGDKSEYFKEKVTLPLGVGIGGYVAETGESVLANDVHKDCRWDSSYDKKTGFCTRSLICVPIKFQGKVLGVIEVINKKRGDFTPRDVRSLEILAAQAGGPIANAKIHEQLEEAYEALKVLDKAKERIINHLSHELKTPLAIISGAFNRISYLLRDADDLGVEKTIDRGRRNLKRLEELQEKIDDILNKKPVAEKDRIFGIIEDAASFVEELREGSGAEFGRILEQISQRIDSIFRTEEACPQRIHLDEVLTCVCEETAAAMGQRDLKIITKFEGGIVLTLDRTVLNKVCTGLLRNAIENTPDEGKIEIECGVKNGEVYVDFRDYGIGITPQNQKMIFGGFFHTQDTDFYSSKTPYAFNAGGSGSDLLRTRIFSERHGFSIDFESTRCQFMPSDRDMCPGRISTCPFVNGKAECFASGSVFSLKFPAFKRLEA